MRRLLFTILIFLSFAASAQFTNTHEQSNQNTREVFKGGVKVNRGIINSIYPDTATANLNPIAFYHAGMIVVQDTLFIRNVTADKWIKVGSGSGGGILNTASEGLTVTGSDVRLFGPISSPALLSTDRSINLGRKSLLLHNSENITTVGGPIWQHSDRSFAPYQFFSTDTLVANGIDPPTAAMPVSGIFARRTLFYNTGIFATQKIYGHYLGMTYNWQDSLRFFTQGGDFNQAVIAELRLKPRGTGPQRTGINGTGNNLLPNQGMPAFVSNTILDNTDGVNTIHTYGWLTGISSYLVASENDTIERFSFYQTNMFTNASTRIRKLYGLDFQHLIAGSVADSSFGVWDQKGFNHYLRGNTVVGFGAQSSSSDNLRVYGNVNIIGTANTTLFQVNNSLGNDLITVNATAGSEVTSFKAYNTTGNDNVAGVQAATTNTSASLTLTSNFDLTTNQASIVFTTDATTSLIAHSATTHEFTGLLRPATDNSFALGDATHRWTQLHVMGSSIKMYGSSSGVITLGSLAAAGTYTLTLPPDDGSIGQFLRTDGNGVLTWVTAAGAGDVSKVGTPVNNQVGVWTGDGSIEGDPNLTFASSTLNIGVAGASTGILTMSGVTSGTITIQAASVAGTYTLTLPQNDGSLNQVLTTDGAGILSWETPAGGGGANTALSNLAAVAINTSLISDANNTDDLGSSANSWKDIYSRQLILDGSTSGTVTISSDALSNTLNVTTLSGLGYGVAWMESRETSDFTGQNINTVQPMFNTAQDVFTLQASTAYDFEGFLSLNHGATSHSVGLSFELGGGASVTSISYYTICWVTAIGTNTASQTTNFIQATTNTNINAAGANATEQIYFRGTINMNAGGTVTPSYTYSAAPGGTVLTKAGSMIRFTPKGTNTFTTIGNVN